jgi:hypothetical protein
MTKRVMISTPPPAGKGTITSMGLSPGQAVCARTMEGVASRLADAKRLRRLIMIFPPYLCSKA